MSGPNDTIAERLTFAIASESLLRRGCRRMPWPPAKAPSLDEPRLPLEVLEPAKDVSGTARMLCLVGAGPAGLLAWPLVLVLHTMIAGQGSGQWCSWPCRWRSFCTGCSTGVGTVAQGWPGSWCRAAQAAGLERFKPSQGWPSSWYQPARAAGFESCQPSQSWSGSWCQPCTGCRA